MKVKRIASYETTDGKLFTDKNEARNHQRELDRHAELAKLVQDTMAADMLAGEIILTPARLATWLIEQQESLRSILPQRKPKTDAGEAPAQDSPAANDASPASTEPAAA